MVIMRHSTYFSSVVICLYMLLLVGCAESKIGASIEPTPDGGSDAQDSPDTGPATDITSPSDADAETTPDADAEDVEDVDITEPSTVDYRACVLGEDEPWSTCADPRSWISAPSWRAIRWCEACAWITRAMSRSASPRPRLRTRTSLSAPLSLVRTPHPS